jgi:LysM repeat protein
MKIVNLPRFIVSMTIIVCIIFFVMSMLTNVVFSASPVEYETITVAEGDTLWSIASALEGNIRENIYTIKEINNLESSMIYVGQEILVPQI